MWARGCTWRIWRRRRSRHGATSSRRGPSTPAIPRCWRQWQSCGRRYATCTGKTSLESSGGRMIPEITPKELKSRLDAGEDIDIIDIREDWELLQSHLDGA